MTRMLRCDGCSKTVTADRGDYYGADASYIHVEASEDADAADLCSWTCLATWAMSKAMDPEVKADG